LAEAGAAEPGTVWATTDGWSAVLEPLFRTRRQRDEFLPPLTAPAAAPPAAGLEISTDLDRIAVSYSVALARESPGEPQSPWLLDVWGGPDGFARGSFGVGVFRDGQLAGLCAACAVAGNAQPPEAEIEIWTVERERRTGLASMSGALFISECHARGMLAAWTCESSNHPSRRLAARLGFRFLRRIDGFPLADRLI
jgi:RimJ/RimL family protein N-acetyltransferase